MQRLEDSLEYDYTNTEELEKRFREFDVTIDQMTGKVDLAAGVRELNNLSNRMEKMFAKSAEKTATIRDC